jgi:hypothetical protein
MSTDPHRLPGGYEVRLSPFGSEIAIVAPGHDAWCVQLPTMRGEYRPTVAVAGWRRLVPETE